MKQTAEYEKLRKYCLRYLAVTSTNSSNYQLPGKKVTTKIFSATVPNKTRNFIITKVSVSTTVYESKYSRMDEINKNYTHHLTGTVSIFSEIIFSIYFLNKIYKKLKINCRWQTIYTPWKHHSIRFSDVSGYKKRTLAWNGLVFKSFRLQRIAPSIYFNILQLCCCAIFPSWISWYMS